MWNFSFCAVKGANLFSWFLGPNFYSRMNDTNNWSSGNESFNIISNKYGSFSLDRFANNFSKKINKFNSRYFCLETSHVNAFTDDWRRDHNWLCPPISCIGSALRHLISCKARWALLVPIWLSSYYWPLISTDGDQMADFVMQYIVKEPKKSWKSINRCLMVILNSKH